MSDCSTNALEPKRKTKRQPEFVDDGLLVCRNASVYVCDGEDTRAHGFDVHLNIGDNQEFDNICFDSTATLYDRSTLLEAWQDAADWLHDTAQTLQVMANYIRANDFFEEVEDVED